MAVGSSGRNEEISRAFELTFPHECGFCSMGQRLKGSKDKGCLKQDDTEAPSSLMGVLD